MDGACGQRQIVYSGPEGAGSLHLFFCYAPGSVAGSGSVSDLQSIKLEELRSRIAQIGLDTPRIIEDPGIHLLKITDPNGQLIEFFKLIN